jgi:methyltransferase (TIGR00027 family)
MIAAQPSRTALAAAMYRAAHQELDGGRIFADPYAGRILDEPARARMAAWAEARPVMRLFIATRSAIAESKLAEAVGRGVRQIVVLGAGLDTLCVRNPYPDLPLYEVDHPATQAWKRERLAAAGLVAGSNVRFVPVDFERQVLGEELAAAGFRSAEPAFVLWLGVVPYLTEDAVFGTLRSIAATAGNELVFDYANPAGQLDPEIRAAHEARAKRAASIGEPFLSSFDTAALQARLRESGASAIDDFGPQRLAAASGRAANNDRGGHIVHVRF